MVGMKTSYIIFALIGFALVSTFVTPVNAEEFDFEFIDSRNYVVSYETTNVTVDVTQRPPEEFVFEANGTNGEIHVSLPRSIPRYLYDDYPAIVLLNSHEYANYTESNCFYDYVFPVEGNTRIQFIFAYPPERPLPIYYEDLPAECTSKTVPSPLQQLKAGILIDEIQCKKGLYKMFRPSNENPACVSESTLERLVQRGWKEPAVCHSCGIVIFEKATMPDDFGFVYSFGVGGKNVLDTKKMSYTKDMVCDPLVGINLNLSQNELYKIWDSAYKNGFFDLPSFTDSCDASGNCKFVTPEQLTTLTITMDGKSHSVTHRDSYISKQGDNYPKFQNVVNVIDTILDKKPAIQNMPKPRCGYQ